MFTNIWRDIWFEILTYENNFTIVVNETHTSVCTCSVRIANLNLLLDDLNNETFIYRNVTATLIYQVEKINLQLFITFSASNQCIQ